VSLTAKLLGVIVPVFVAITFCLTVPFIILVADGLILVAAVVAFLVSRGSAPLAQEQGVPVND